MNYYYVIYKLLQSMGQYELMMHAPLLKKQDHDLYNMIEYGT